MISDYLPSIITSASITTAMVWLGRTWISERLKNSIKSEYDQKLETHKSKLKAQTEVEVEKLRSRLSIVAAERNIVFSKLHSDRADVIATTYALLKDVYETFQDYVKMFEPAGGKSKEERRLAATDAHLALREYYPKKVIYLPKSTVETIENINMELVKTFNEFFMTVDVGKSSDTTNKWIEISTKMSGEMEMALTGLEDEFRKLLGDDLPDSN